MPKLRADHPPHQLTRIELGPELGQRFMEMAQRHDRSLSAEARQAIKHWIQKHQEVEA